MKKPGPPTVVGQPWRALGISRATYYRKKKPKPKPKKPGPPVVVGQPWKALGISKATYYRCKKATGK